MTCPTHPQYTFRVGRPVYSAVPSVAEFRSQSHDQLPMTRVAEIDLVKHANATRLTQRAHKPVGMIANPHPFMSAFSPLWSGIAHKAPINADARRSG